MALSPQFLDQLRARVSLGVLVGRRVKLTAKGRGESVGLCPFHQEKSPSFTVSETKGFFHCFGCGAHGDVFDFVMKAERRDFMEAVELLAAEAHLEVPKPSPEARAEAERQASLGSVLDRARQFFADQLDSAEGAAARAYLMGRGLDRDAWERFGIGYAPARRFLLGQTLGRSAPEALLIEAGLLKRDDERGLYDFFRDRVMFPIFDRRGRTVGFGGRVLGDAKPKYLNSPDSPVFHKGRMLYGANWARDAVAEGQPLLVTEGYMDVIALQRAGFGGAVAPLGTALTEEQLGELWSLTPEPVLAFDGDAAGQRAAARAIERALPLMGAGRSLRLATLPSGEDPDSLLRRDGVAAMRNVVERAEPLADYLFRLEQSAGPLDTPERRHALEQRLMARAAAIPDDGLARQYRQFFRDRLYARPKPTIRMQARGRNGPPAAEQCPPDPGALGQRLQEALVIGVLRCPAILGEVDDEFGRLVFDRPALDKLRREILNAHVNHPALDAAALEHHLTQTGFAEDLAALGSARALTHARFVRSADPASVLVGWRDALAQWERRSRGRVDLEEAVGRSDLDLVGAIDRLRTMQTDEAERRRR